jgi:hypothetical protein
MKAMPEQHWEAFWSTIHCVVESLDHHPVGTLEWRRTCCCSPFLLTEKIIRKFFLRLGMLLRGRTII